MLRNLVRENVPRYMAARTKHDKGTIIVEILETIKRESPTGVGLVRQNPQNGRWSYIGNDKAKDKIGHALRKSSRDYHKMNHNDPPSSSSSSSSHKRRAWSPHSLSASRSGGIRGTIDNNSAGKNKLQLYTTTTTTTTPEPAPSSVSTSSRQTTAVADHPSVSSGRIRHASSPPRISYHYPPPPPHHHHPHHHHAPHPPQYHSDQHSHHDYYYPPQHSHAPHHAHPHHPHVHHHHRYPPPHSHYPPPPPSSANYHDDPHPPPPPHHYKYETTKGAFQAIHPPPCPVSTPTSRTPVHVSSCSTSSILPKDSSSHATVPVAEVSVPVARPNSVNSNISSKSSASSSTSSPPKVAAHQFYRKTQHAESSMASPQRSFGYNHHKGNAAHPPPPPSSRQHPYAQWEGHAHHQGAAVRQEYHRPDAEGPERAFQPPKPQHEEDHFLSHRIFDEVEEQRRETEAEEAAPHYPHSYDPAAAASHPHGYPPISPPRSQYHYQ